MANGLGYHSRPFFYFIRHPYFCFWFGPRPYLQVGMVSLHFNSD